ncbi:ATP-binding protein [Streptomyces spiramenti]|uniref:histidine kinase n=1 Tax=Streptomyces spiramenti TaxID=2720606 RepID=A0ABX1AK49_9ACTN|nr:sensor histidine kinase [Streptomyces spiramenti]NJP67494.1 sensor histidine kinase [Streptomyces spiramenti]
MRLPRPRPLSLTGSLFVGYATLLALALAATGALWIAQFDRELDRQYAERVLTIARSVSAMPEVGGAMDAPDPAAVISPRAEAVREATRAEYIVVATTDGIRMSHVNQSLIGEVVSTPPGPAAVGEEWSGVETGTRGTTVRAKVPLTHDGTADGRLVGYVSVGILTSEIDTEVNNALPSILGTTVAVLLLGGAGAFVLSRRVRAKTHGLEPVEITALLEGREALLYAVREGVLAVDTEGRVTLVNPPARHMLGLPDDSEGRPLAELGPADRLLDVVSGADPGEDRIVLVGARILVCNRMPVQVKGRAAGAVVTFRDRTELDRLTGELDGARTVTRGLRAQSHEYANRIHTVAGMLELGAVEEARDYLTDLSAAHALTSGEISRSVADPALAALALAKSAQASERGSELRLSPMTQVPERLRGALRDDVLLVVGNLVDNALDSVAESGPGGWVELLVRTHPALPGRLAHDLVEVRVTDSGRGVADGLAEEIFDYGFTTKVSRGGTRGLGLALVRQVCESRGGTVGVEVLTQENEEGAVFTAYLPDAEREAPRESRTAADRADEPAAPNGAAPAPRYRPHGDRTAHGRTDRG